MIGFKERKKQNKTKQNKTKQNKKQTTNKQNKKQKKKNKGQIEEKRDRARQREILTVVFINCYYDSLFNTQYLTVGLSRLNVRLLCVRHVIIR